MYRLWLELERDGQWATLTRLHEGELVDCEYPSRDAALMAGAVILPRAYARVQADGQWTSLRWCVIDSKGRLTGCHYLQQCEGHCPMLFN